MIVLCKLCNEETEVDNEFYETHQVPLWDYYCDYCVTDGNTTIQ